MAKKSVAVSLRQIATRGTVSYACTTVLLGPNVRIVAGWLGQVRYLLLQNLVKPCSGQWIPAVFGVFARSCLVDVAVLPVRVPKSGDYTQNPKSGSDQSEKARK